MVVYTGIKELLTFAGVVAKDGRHPTEEDLAIIKDAAIIVGDKRDGDKAGKILWAGSQRKSRSALKALDAERVKEIPLDARTVMPAFTDCHTHLVFAGDRAHEFELRNQGATYQEIASQGGGIQFTVKQTCKASTKQLLTLAQSRLNHHIRQGVTTVEIKSGYGLTEKDELRILEVIKKLKSLTAARIVATYLGPHSTPPWVDSSKPLTKEEYYREILASTLSKVKSKKLAERVDIFIEENFYTLSEAREYARKAQDFGFTLTAHTDQLTRSGACFEMAKLGALSVDHCVQISPSDIQDLARTEAVTVLLPASDFYLKMKYPPARALIDAGARVALATDYNPGTSPTLDLSFVGVLARLEMRMTQPEVLAAWTYNSARALGLQNQLGALQPGFSADFVTLDENWRSLFYEVGHHPVAQTFCHGRKIFVANDKKGFLG